MPHNLGLGASLLIRPGCRCIDSADAKTFVWIQPGCCCYLFGRGAISFQSWQVGHSFPASSPFHPKFGKFAASLFAAVSWCTTGIQQNLPGLSATFIPHGWCAMFIKLAWLALFERTFCETFCQNLDNCWKSFCETSSPGVGILEAYRKLLLKRENPTAFWTSFLKKKSPAVQQSVIVGKMDRGTVKFLMFFKGSLLPPLTHLLFRIQGSVPQQNAPFWTILII